MYGYSTIQSLIITDFDDYHDSPKEEVNLNITSTFNDVTEYLKDTFDDKVPLPARRATEDHTL